MLSKIIAWLKQPTSVAGESALVGIATAIAGGQITLAQAAPLIAGAIAAIAFPDNTALKQATPMIATDVVAALMAATKASNAAHDAALPFPPPAQSAPVV